MALKQVIPSLEEIRLCDLNLQKAEKLAAEFEGIIKVIPTNNLEEALRGADIIAHHDYQHQALCKGRVCKRGRNDYTDELLRSGKRCSQKG